MHALWNMCLHGRAHALQPSSYPSSQIQQTSASGSNDWSSSSPSPSPSPSFPSLSFPSSLLSLLLLSRRAAPPTAVSLGLPAPDGPFSSFGSALATTPAAGVLDGDDAPGARAAVSMAKAVYVQMRRMFEDLIIGEDTPPVPSGYPLCTIGEKAEVLCKAKMYYELQRGVKKLRF